MTKGLVFMEGWIGSLKAGILDRSVNGKGSWEKSLVMDFCSSKSALLDLFLLSLFQKLGYG